MKSPLGPTYLGMVKRLDKDDLMRYCYVYDSISNDFLNRHLEGKELAEFKYQRYMRDYAKVLKSLDDNVGRVLDYLEEKGMLDSTLVVYTSDQGFYMGEHGWFDKRFMYEESLSTPLVMHLPKGLEARGNIQEMVQNIDYARPSWSWPAPRCPRTSRARRSSRCWRASTRATGGSPSITTSTNIPPSTW